MSCLYNADGELYSLILLSHVFSTILTPYLFVTQSMTSILILNFVHFTLTNPEIYFPLNSNIINYKMHNTKKENSVYTCIYKYVYI